MKLLQIIGARPQFIKAAALSREINLFSDLQDVIVHTGQHFDPNMSEIFFEEMGIPLPNYNLHVHGLGHGAMTGRMLEEIEKVILTEKPDCVIVYGDTNSTLAGALAAKKLHLPVAHIEAGLRSFNMKMPEEINRILTDRISDYLFCPTQTAVNNLKQEGFEHFKTRIIQSGDIMYDTSLFYAKISKGRSQIIEKLSLEGKPFVLATIHRAENTDDLNRLTAIIDALNELSKEIRIVLPLHPRTRSIIEKNKIHYSFTVIEPVGYFDMLEMLKECSLVMTDSGGLQKEAYFFNKFCLTLRDETEWTELIESKVNALVGADKEKILNNFAQFYQKQFDQRSGLYGDGHSANVIIQELKKTV